MPYEKASLMAVVKPTRLDLIHPTMSLTGSRKSMKTVSGNAVGSARVRANRTESTTAAAATAATILRWRLVSPARRKRGSIHSPALISQAVQHDGQDHDRESGLECGSDIDGLQGAQRHRRRVPGHR